MLEEHAVLYTDLKGPGKTMMVHSEFQQALAAHEARLRIFMFVFYACAARLSTPYQQCRCTASR